MEPVSHPGPPVLWAESTLPPLLRIGTWESCGVIRKYYELETHKFNNLDEVNKFLEMKTTKTHLQKNKIALIVLYLLNTLNF